MKKLYRDPQAGYLGGVCAGLGEHTNLDPIIWRIIFLLGLGPIVYIGLWIFVKKCCNGTV